MGVNNGVKRTTSRSTSPPEKPYNQQQQLQQRQSPLGETNNNQQLQQSASTSLAHPNSTSVVDSGYGSLDMLKVAADAAAASSSSITKTDGSSKLQPSYQRSTSSRTPYYSPVQSRRSLSTVRNAPAVNTMPSMKDTAYDRVVFNLKNK